MRVTATPRPSIRHEGTGPETLVEHAVRGTSELLPSFSSILYRSPWPTSRETNDRQKATHSKAASVDSVSAHNCARPDCFFCVRTGGGRARMMSRSSYGPWCCLCCCRCFTHVRSTVALSRRAGPVVCVVSVLPTSFPASSWSCKPERVKPRLEGGVIEDSNARRRRRWLVRMHSTSRAPSPYPATEDSLSQQRRNEALSQQ